MGTSNTSFYGIEPVAVEGRRERVDDFFAGVGVAEIGRADLHGAGPGQALPYPEVYEVVKGTIAFVMQYDPLFDTPDRGPGRRGRR